MTAITDAMMRERLSKTKAYAVVLLRRGPLWDSPDARAVIWEHGRRNFELREAKKLAIVCPIAGSGDLAGIGIFDADADETDRIMRDDPAVKAGVLAFEIHACRSFPGDMLPA
jgi:hypothetical protein